MRPLPALIAMGAGWGLTMPLAKFVVEAGRAPIVLIAWQTTIAALLLGGMLAVRGGVPRPTAARLRVWLLIVASGTVLPGLASYTAADHLPAGIMSILIATVAIMAFPMALALGTDRFAWGRLAGLLLGLLGISLIAAPGALPAASSLGGVALGLVAPALYAFEGNAVARWGTAGMDGVQTLFGASVLGVSVSLPIALSGGAALDGWGMPEWALLGMSVIHALTYASYVWLVGRAGATFAAQVSYLVTVFGILWSMILLGERYGPAIWVSVALVLLGVALVRPREA